MHGEIGAAIGNRVFQLLHEKALAARLVQAPVDELVTASRHRHKAHFELGMQLLQARLDVLGLPEREPAFARRDREPLHGTSARTADHWRRLTGSRSWTP